MEALAGSRALPNSGPKLPGSEPLLTTVSTCKRLKSSTVWVQLLRMISRCSLAPARAAATMKGWWSSCEGVHGQRVELGTAVDDDTRRSVSDASLKSGIEDLPACDIVAAVFDLGYEVKGETACRSLGWRAGEGSCHIVFAQIFWGDIQ